jgi:hydrogenase expression/formation protein HypD
MKYVDEYRDPQLARAISDEVARLSAGQPLKIMEVCGGHTHTIYKHGVEDVLPRNIDLVHGPGCPVCVLPMGRIDDAIAIAQSKGVIFTTFGDMMRVPGSKGSLLDAKAQGADVRFVYSPLDALKLARQHPEREVVFFAIGFETTAPSTAVTLLRAQAEGITNFSVFCNHVMIIPAIKAILDSPDLRLDGFVGPGHVSMVIGMRPYAFVAREHHKPLVVAGFEPLDILQSVRMIVQQIQDGRAEIENQYGRVVRPEGNTRALEAMARTMELRPFFEWRGLGFITQSALKLRPEFAAWDAEQRFEVPGIRVADPKACQCGEVLKGVIKPWECKVFGTACTPETPIGTCMVSSEGACAAYFNYGRYSQAAERAGVTTIRLNPAAQQEQSA